MKIFYGAISRKELSRLGFSIPILESFFSIKGKPLEIPSDSSGFFLDSGAFSAYTQNRPIELEAYTNYLDSLETMPEVVASLDVIGNPVKSLSNWLELKRRGFNTLPVFHFGSSFEYLHEYVRNGATYIGLGGIAKVNARERVPFIDKIFNAYPDPKSVGFHGFGIGHYLYSEFPWISVDSTTQSSAARFGCIYTPFRKDTVSIVKASTHYTSMSNRPEVLKRLKEWVESLGCNWEVACIGGSGGYLERLKIGILFSESIRTSTPARYNVTRRTLL